MFVRSLHSSSSSVNSPLVRSLVWRGWLILLVLFTGYVCLFTTLAFNLHTGMRTHKADLGQIAQAVWNSSHGRFVEMTDNGYIATRMTDHVEPILALNSPVLWLWRDVRALLLLQVLVVAVGGVLLYALVQHLLFNGMKERTEKQDITHVALPLALSVAYFLSP